MELYPLISTDAAANCYLLTEDGRRAVAIDPATPRVLIEAEKQGLEIEYILLTHGHFDHVGGVDALRRAGAKAGCLAAEKRLAEEDNLASSLGGLEDFPPVKIDFTFEDGEILELAGMQFRVLATPGHTAGSCCFCTDIGIFSGDTLFRGGVGRCDLPTGNFKKLLKSLEKLFALSAQGDCLVYPGHGLSTTLEREMSC